MIHRRTLSKAPLETLHVRDGLDKHRNRGYARLQRTKQENRGTHRVTEVFPVGALARKSLAMGFTQRTNTRTGDRKLACSRNLDETAGKDKAAESCSGLMSAALGLNVALFTGQVGGPSSSSRHPGESEPISGRGRPRGTRRRRRRQPDPASPSVSSLGFWKT